VRQYLLPKLQTWSFGINNMKTLRTLRIVYLLLTVSVHINPAARAFTSEGGDYFERRVRPLLIERCHKCHAGTKNKGGLRLDSREAVLKGGGSGPAVISGKPDESLLLRAVRHQDGLAMPPDGKLNESQIAALAEWIKSGAVWPGPAATTTAESTSAGSSISPVSPNDGELALSLQLWLRADSLALNDGAPVYIWPDQSGHGRDMSATKGVRPDGVGLPGRFSSRSSVMRRPAVRFDPTTGLASSPGNPVEIRGDAALTIMLVMNVERHQAKPPFDCVFGIGNPAHTRDPGKPTAALVQINRDEDYALHFAGGWNHDVSLGRGSFKSHYGKPVLLTIIKQPGPMRSTTRVYVDGVAATVHGGEPLEGRDEVPDFQHRSDIGTYVGKALGWCGAIQGDVGEVVVYNKALDDRRRSSVEGHLAEKFGLWLGSLQDKAAPAAFTPEEKGFWAYQPVNDRAPPAVRDEAWVKTPIDRFILHSLEERQLNPAESVDKLMLLRRVTFDLIGLPPTPGEVAAFLSDNSAQAYEKVVNRLLDSRQYGVRWGRHWLDVVRFAETTANDANAVMRYACQYRNYVIDAFNRDLPYDQFLIEQLAGDLLPPTDSISVNTRRIIATGFLMVGPKALAETDKEQSRLDIVDDQIDVTGRAMLGLTLACARCHDHKFDAIRTTDYYALAGIFRSTEPFQDEVRNATMWWEIPVPQGAGVTPMMVMAPRDSQPRNLRVHLRGNRFTLGKIVPRGVLQVIPQVGDKTEQRTWSSVDPSQLDSGRLELAHWIASPANPLTARVMVNRIWQHHFGRGLVATSDNFGTRGERPSHPELLDWLASRFVESGWSVKAMHRLMVLSSTYQQGGTPSVATRQADPDRKWRSSFARRRLSAEELRDAVLAVSGKLDLSPGTNESGELLYEKSENIKQKFRPNLLAADDPIYTRFQKRTVYLPVVRNILPDVLALFDGADPNGVTAVRNDTTVPSQSLFLLNSPFVREQARCFSERLLAVDELSDDQRIERAHATAFGRLPTPAEMSDSRDFFAAYVGARAAQALSVPDRRLAAWQSFCQLLMCSNEFLYVE
jgi:hypothetical protein